MSAGRFRQDLFYRLNVVPMRLPPLKERRDDIPPLLDHLMRRAAEQTGLRCGAWATTRSPMLQTYEWPGNVRQLKNVIDWMLIMAPGGPDDVIGPICCRRISGPSLSPITCTDGNEVMSLPLREAREIFERRYLESQVTAVRRQHLADGAFRRHGRSALHRKLRSLGITTSDKAEKADQP